MTDRIDTPQASALFLSAFFDELIVAGVRDVVVSPGSRSTPLAMVAYASDLMLYVDVDERGAAFFALGLAKASGQPVCLICTSGTAIANYYPAILESESSRVPLIVLTGDRPPRLQNLGAPQTCDQLKAYGDHVRHFQQMPLSAASSEDIAFARQMGKTAYLHAVGGEAAGPVHFNFPFDEPLKPDLSVAGLFEIGRGRLAIETDGDRFSRAQETCMVPPLVSAASRLSASQVKMLAQLIKDKRTIVLAGEGSCASATEARELTAWAKQYGIPLLADPLSGLRNCTDPLVIDNYDNIFGKAGCPEFDAIIRFGRYPVSKKCSTAIGAKRPIQIVVDPHETRDFNAATDIFVRCDPAGFIRSFGILEPTEPSVAQHASACAWIKRNEEERLRIEQVADVSAGFEGAYVAKLFELAPEDSLVFSANSMAIRAIDTFYLKSDKHLAVLCNRGLNGIDGTVSSAFGAAQYFSQTTLLTGDLTLIHDLNALALHHELIDHHGGEQASSIIVVVLNNHGGAIFDMLPQQSEDSYFERLFLTPQRVDFEQAARAFGVPYRFTDSVASFTEAYGSLLGSPGVSLIEVPVLLGGLKERY
ncbi:MAG: 2-succinyl-5-enolpyruvyl-6-hydroxy-3-cyclohexene-1-carboxylic-acid synthase, partial [Raoultibacter sp.]